jgi:hypothetical protein
MPPEIKVSPVNSQLKECVDVIGGFLAQLKLLSMNYISSNFDFDNSIKNWLFCS